MRTFLRKINGELVELLNNKESQKEGGNPSIGRIFPAILKYDGIAAPDGFMYVLLIDDASGNVLIKIISKSRGKHIDIMELLFCESICIFSLGMVHDNLEFMDNFFRRMISKSCIYSITKLSQVAKSVIK